MDIEKALERTNRILTVDNDKIKTQIYVSDLKAILNELDKKEKIINEMAEELKDYYMDNLLDYRKITKKYVIEKFTKKAEGK